MDKRRRGAFVPGPQRSKNVPVKRATTEPRKKSAGSLPNMNKNSMLIVEANEIAQYLKKDYEFLMNGDGSVQDENLMQVHVRQTDLAVSCIWPLSKLKERLVKMRKLMYADETEAQGLGRDSVFFDPKDVWIKDEDIEPTESNTLDNQETDYVGSNHRQQNHLNENGHISDTGSTSSNKDNASPKHVINGNHVDYNNGPNKNLETLSNETALPSVSVSYAFNSSAGSSKLGDSPGSLNGDISRMNGTSFNSTASSELPADSEFFTLSMTSPMSPPPPNRDFGQNNIAKGNKGVLPEKYFTSSGTKASEAYLPESQMKESPEKNSPSQDPQHSKHTPIIKNRSPNPNTSPNLSKGTRRTKKREGGGITFNLDLQKSSQIPNSTISKDLPVSKTVNKNSSTSPLKTRGFVPVKPNSNKSVVSKTSQHSFVCQKCGSSNSEGSNVVREKQKEPSKKGISVLRMCRDMVKTLSYRCRGPPRHDSLVDRILYNCEVVKVAVINILESYTQTQDSKHDIASFADSELMKLTTIQLVSALELLVSHTTLWTSSFIDVDSGLVKEMCTDMNKVVKELTKEMVVFLQTCETDKDVHASESATKVIDLMYEVVKHCGELALATETCPSLLIDKRPASLEELKALRNQRDDDLLNMKPSQDVKQSFMIGCDAWMDQHLQSCAATLEHCEKQAQMLSEDCYASQCSEEVGKQVYITVGTVKILVLKCQDLQVELSHNMREESHKPDNYFFHYFMRNQGVLANLATLADSVTLLCQAADPLAEEEDPSALKKVCRCAEMIYKSALKLVLSSSTDNQCTRSADSSLHSSFSSINGLSLETSKLSASENKGISIVLSEIQCDQVEQFGEDVKLATHSLVTLIKKRLPVDSASNTGKVKRMLPATPGGGRGQILRCKSAKYPDRLRRSVSYYDVGHGGDM